MAIPFLNNISLNNNELQNARLHNTGSANTNPGQIYFDTGDNLAKYYSNGTDTWVSLKDYSFSNGTFVNLSTSGTTAKPIITFDLNAIDGTAAAGERYLTKNNTWAEVASIPGTYNFNVSDGTNSTQVDSGETVTFSGTTNETTVVESGGTVTIGLPNNVTIAGNLTVIGTTTTNNVETVSTSNGVIFEGNAADGSELTLLAGTLTSDQTITLPDATGTVALTSELHSAVTLAGSYDYITLSGQQLTLNQIDYTTDIANTPTLPTNADTTYAVTISDTATITHGLETKDVIIQLYDVTTNETVYADVLRVDAIPYDTATITFATTPTNPIRVLVQKIG